MTYIKLEDVQNLIESSTGYFENDRCLYAVLEKIDSLPSIDFEGVVKEMIEELDFDFESEKELLQELLNKLP